MNDDSFFSAPLTLPYSAINANGRVNADWMLNVFQDVATRHCHLLGVSGFDMAKKKLKWVVAQYQFTIHHEFEWMMPLVVKTRRAPWRNLYEIRQFALCTEQGDELVTATSIWILIKAASGKPVRLTPHMPSNLLEAPAGQAPEFIKPNTFQQYHHETLFPVRFLDLDLNQHVNNRVYLRWAVQTMPEPYCFEFAPLHCTILYRKEALFGDTIASRIHLQFSDSNLLTDHAIVRKDTGEELARLLFKWENTPPIKLL